MILAVKAYLIHRWLDASSLQQLLDCLNATVADADASDKALHCRGYSLSQEFDFLNVWSLNI